MIVTSWSRYQLELAHNVATNAGLLPSTITPGITNGYRSFFVPPDGSKEGWGESDRGDSARDDFVEYLRAKENEDGSSYLSWVEVSYGDDNGGCAVVRHGDDSVKQRES
jgi:hypothetical protein